jgi:hypothetical protein
MDRRTSLLMARHRKPSLMRHRALEKEALYTALVMMS